MIWSLSIKAGEIRAATYAQISARQCAGLQIGPHSTLRRERFFKAGLRARARERSATSASLEQKGLTGLLDEIGGGGRSSVMYCKGGGRNAEPHIGVEVQICEGRSGIPPLGLFGKRENPMHTKNFILAGIALIGSGISSAIS